jgi:carboxypeptidase family protein
MRFVAAVLACLMCAGAAKAQLGPPSMRGSGTLEGTIARGPLTPVERPGIPSSAPVAAAQIEIATPDGKKAATVQSDSAGEYSAQLAPGIYVVTVTSPATALSKNLPATVTIKEGAATHLDIRLDTGIR